MLPNFTAVKLYATNHMRAKRVVNTLYNAGNFREVKVLPLYDILCNTTHGRLVTTCYMDAYDTKPYHKHFVKMIGVIKIHQQRFQGQQRAHEGHNIKYGLMYKIKYGPEIKCGTNLSREDQSQKKGCKGSSLMMMTHKLTAYH